MNCYFGGIDIGTSGIRAVIFDENGFEICEAHEEYSILYSDKFAELDTEVVFDAFLRVVSLAIERLRSEQGMESNVCAFGISCQMHSLILVDADGMPLTNTITWADTRALKEADDIASKHDCFELYRQTGCIVNHAMYPLSKIIWFRENEPEIFAKTKRFLSLKEFILFRLYGRYVVDYTIAASQGYYDIHSQAWSDGILQDVAGISRKYLSEVVPCTHVLRGMKSEFANIMGIDTQIAMTVGSGDGIMANIGCGVFDENRFSSTIGTSGAVRTASSQPILDDQMRTWCYSFTDDTWVSGGAINNGGLVLKWIKQNMGTQLLADANKCVEQAGSEWEKANRYFDVGEEYAAMDYLAARVPAGSAGLICLPYLTGERSPDWNADVRGMVGGMSLHHGNAHFVRASMEGIIYRLYSVYEALVSEPSRMASSTDVKPDKKQLLATGGYISSDFWLQMQADVFNADIQISAVKQSAALGAAYTAMAAVGAIKDMKTPLLAMKPVKDYQPDVGRHEAYMEYYKRAIRFYDRVTLG